ncbi:MAG TPA: hypothetical protein VK866_15280 [Acidimicrobiales bacterium]|nr:hypothetical protein [Acidimicrobiales bacterium]
MPHSLVLHDEAEREERRIRRLAEMVMHLTGCSADEALVEVRRAPATDADDLTCVARAIVRVRG